jgi:DNA-directed RNA polymerase subunit A'
VRVSSSEDNEINVDEIADRVMDAEFEDDAERRQFLGEREPSTNLSEHADARRMDEDPVSDVVPAAPGVDDD